MTTNSKIKRKGESLLFLSLRYGPESMLSRSLGSFSSDPLEALTGGTLSVWQPAPWEILLTGAPLVSPQIQ